MFLLASALFEVLLRQASVQPAAVFDQAAQIRAQPWRERIEREAFFALASKDPRGAHARITRVLGEPWLADLPFTLALEQAYALPPAQGRPLLESAARRQPEVALRAATTCLRFPYGTEVLAAAIAEAPEEAALLAASQNPTGTALRPLVKFHDPRTAVFLTRGKAPREPRIAALLDEYRADPSPYWRRAAEAEAQEFYRVARENKLAPLRTLNAAQLLTLATLARIEDDDEIFPDILAAVRGKVPVLPDPILRRVMAIAATRRLFTSFDQPRLVQQACANITTVSDAIDAASILAATRHKPRLGDSSLERLLAAPSAPSRLALGSDIVQRFVFPNDDDGVESFESFRAAYRSDPDWKWEERDGVVVVVSRRNSPRIRIFANVPADIVLQPDLMQQVAARQSLVDSLLPHSPDVLVHRGHDYHVPRTLPLIPPGVKLVFLGSCRGTHVMEEVILSAPNAQIVATRGIGTKEVNDPFLKAMNRQLLARGGMIDWRPFWRELAGMLASNEHFVDYIPPPDNAAANFLREYYRYLASL